MKTSNFSKSGRNENSVAICAKIPDWYKGKCYKKLAPSYSIFTEWMKTHDKELYKKRFINEILSKLDPSSVFRDLGDDAILICYEKSGDFCHRRIVADWFEKELNIKVEEI